MGASEVISFIDNNDFFSHSIKIKSNLVSLIRSRIRFIYSELYENNQESTTAARLRLELLKLQSSTELPDINILQECNLDKVNNVRRQYGDSVADACFELIKLFKALQHKDSPLLKTLINRTEEAIIEVGLSNIKIWCHRNEKDTIVRQFQEHEIYLTNENFIHNLTQYRTTSLFEILIKIGPLRNYGWCKTPNIILTAPRFKKLIQIVWSGMPNEPDYEKDPFMSNLQSKALFSYSEEQLDASTDLNLEGELTIEADNQEEFDDFDFLKQRPISVIRETKTLLLELPEEMAVLIRPGSERLIFDISDYAKIKVTQVDKIKPNQYIITHNIRTDLGDEQIELEKTEWAKVWKKELKRQFDLGRWTLYSKMRNAGINLIHLESAAKRWMSMDGNVITAPQTKEHFRILIESVLAGCLERNQWKKAWREVQASNVKAMQNGMLENDLTEEQLVEDLKPYLDILKELSVNNDHFVFPLPGSSSLLGTIQFSKILEVSSGFKCPNEKLNSIEHIANLEIYRHISEDYQ